MESTENAATPPEKRMSLAEIRERVVGENPEDCQIPELPPAPVKGKGFTVFSPFGRLKRLKYVYYLLLNSIGMTFVQASLTVFINSGSTALVIASVAVIILLAGIMILTTIKRFHDFGHELVKIFWLIVPIVDLYWGFKLLFEESDQGDNGFDAMERNSWYWQVPLVVLVPPGLLVLAVMPLLG